MTGPASASGLARRLGPFDAAMIVMGGIIGSGIFATPSSIAKQVHTSSAILAVWAVGGAIALLGAFVYAELANRRPEVGGQYAYLRDGYHPSIAFVYGWALLLVIQSGGMAAVSVVFARYFLEIVPLNVSPRIVSATAVVLLVAINCAGVRAGGTVQNVFMLLKILAIGALIVCGLFFAGAPPRQAGAAQETLAFTAIGAALIPVMFSYGGWQTASFVAGEMRDPRRDLARGLIGGVIGVIVLYTLVNAALLLGLGARGMELTDTPASTLMQGIFGDWGAKFIAIAISISTLGFLSQGMLTAPRVYYAMANDGIFFRSVAKLDGRTQAPVVAIMLQGIMTIVISLSGTFDQILSYVVSVDFIFFGLTAGTLFIFRRRVDGSRGVTSDSAGFRMPLHPFTTALFIVACAFVVASTFVASPGNSLIGVALMLAGIPVFLAWSHRRSVKN